MIAEHLGRSSKPSAETRSWNVSVPRLAGLLVDIALPKVDMLIEFPLPGSSRRVDVLLAGVHPVTGEDNYVVVEQKQWSQAELAWNSDTIVKSRHLLGEYLHPIDQVRGYCTYLQQYIAVLNREPDALHGVAYLHNATQHSVRQLLTRMQDDLGRIFTGDQRAELLDYLRGQFAPEPGTHAADRLLASEILPRKNFLEFTANELREATKYSLLDNQKLAYDAVLNQIRASSAADNKSVILVTGGPGSGKSMVAVSLLAELHRMGRRVRYATGSQSITETMRRFPGNRSPELKSLFTYYRSFSGAEKNDLDVLICDEAHRIRKTSTNRFTKRTTQPDRPQIDELISAARVPVFLLDEHQVVRLDEVGTIDLIRDHAARSGYPVFHIKLDGQFRCGGSAAYDEWVLRLLGIRVGGPTPWTSNDFDVRFATSPKEMEDFLRAKIDNGASARIAAGYCWPWSDPREDGSLVPDVVIGDWSKPWNKKDSRLLGDAPPWTLWATDSRGFEQIGCIYTAQGFEYDWAGVILGPDIVLNDDHLVIRPEYNEERKKLMGTKRNPVPHEDIAVRIRNVYKVLLTRGLRGVVIYAVDRSTQEFVSSLIGQRALELRKPAPDTD